MMRRKNGVAAIALGSVVALTAAGCGGGASTPDASSAAGASAPKAGGTLYYLTKRPAEHMDPQRTYIGRDLSNQSKLVYRTLTQYKSGTKAVSKAIQPDLATDTGTASDGGKVWKFTLKDGVKWEDNSDITCEDLKYGISRTFAVDVITGGPAYAIQFLGIPKDAKGGSTYKGPYVKDAAGQAAFDKAVTCVRSVEGVELLVAQDVRADECLRGQAGGVATGCSDIPRLVGGDRQRLTDLGVLHGLEVRHQVVHEG